MACDSHKARKLRIEYPGAIYHVMNRGDHREDIFKDDQDRRRFLDTLGETCVKTDWRVYAYCLMANHFHLVVETQRGPNHLGQEWQESQVEKAERLVLAAELRGWIEGDLAGEPKTDAVKLEIAMQLRKESTMTIPWIAQRLQMGSPNNLRNRLYSMV